MIYTLLLVVLLVFATIDYGSRASAVQLNANTCSIYKDSNIHYRNRLVITVTAALLFFWFLYATVIMGLRGDFSSDYSSYVVWFHRMNNMGNTEFWDCFGIGNIFSRYMETGYAILNRVIGCFTDNPICLFMVCAVVVCFPAFLQFKKSEMPWLAVLLWISIGPYFEGFNTMRGAMAASILIFSISKIEERKLIPYVCIVLIATAFHSISILMLCAYILPMIKPSKKSIFFIIITAIIVSIFGDLLATYFNSFFHYAYDNVSALSLLHRYSSSGASLLIPLLIEIISLYLFFDGVKKKELDLNDYRIRLLFNGNLLWILFKFLTIYSGYSTRFAMLFFYYPCLFIPFIIYKRKKMKSSYIMIVSLALFWYLINIYFRLPIYYFAI